MVRKGKFSVWFQKMMGLTNGYGLVGANSKCVVQSKRKCKRHARMQTLKCTAPMTFGLSAYK